MASQMTTGPDMVSYRSDARDNWHAAIESGHGVVFVSISNGVSRMEHSLSPDDAAEMAQALTAAVEKSAQNVAPAPTDSGSTR